MIQEPAQGAFFPTGLCKGLCRDELQRNLAMNIVLDKSKLHDGMGREQDWREDGTWYDIPLERGRSINCSPGV